MPRARIGWHLAGWHLLWAASLAGALPGQHGSPHRTRPVQPAPQSNESRTAEPGHAVDEKPDSGKPDSGKPDSGKPEEHRADQNRAARLATHTSRTQLPPLVAWHFVKRGNERYVRERQAKALPTAKKPVHRDVTKTHHGDTHEDGAPIATRPAGANRYVCAVLSCADSDRDVPALLGLDRRDVLELRVPGPFVTGESIALLERTLKKYQTSLILVLSHTNCDSLRIRKQGADDALDRRLLTLRNRARGMRTNLQKAVGLQQREWILASSRAMRDLVKGDRLRIMPGVIDEKTGAITWHQKRVQELPLSPVK